MIKVLIVDDSPVVRELLSHILSGAGGIEICGAVADGEAAVDAAMRLRPDVITMDIEMPKLNGIEATRRIMQTRPAPIVIVSAHWNTGEAATTFEAMRAGAVALLEKPPGPGHVNYSAAARKLIQTVKTMSEVRVVRRWHRALPTSPEIAPPIQSSAAVRLIAIGVSTGGPPVLQQILSLLPPTLPVPIVIVQHIAAGFLPGLATWLDATTSFPTRIAQAGEQLLAGHAYLAPDDYHLGVDARGRVALSAAVPENGSRPAVSFLFRSVKESYGAAAAGVLLTGMGKDGALELKSMREGGALTIAQDEESSVVFGMPGEAVALNAAAHVLPPAAIAALLKRFLC